MPHAIVNEAGEVEIATLYKRRAEQLSRKKGLTLVTITREQLASWVGENLGKEVTYFFDINAGFTKKPRVKAW